MVFPSLNPRPARFTLRPASQDSSSTCALQSEFSTHQTGVKFRSRPCLPLHFCGDNATLSPVTAGHSENRMSRHSLLPPAKFSRPPFPPMKRSLQFPSETPLARCIVILRPTVGRSNRHEKVAHSRFSYHRRQRLPDRTGQVRRADGPQSGRGNPNPLCR